jgi:hypothetical protein
VAARLVPSRDINNCSSELIMVLLNLSQVALQVVVDWSALPKRSLGSSRSIIWSSALSACCD